MLASTLSKLDVFWSPSKRENYIVFGSEITLYKVEKVNPQNSEQVQSTLLSDNTYGKFLSQNAESQFPKCMAWYPKPNRDYLVAVGQANGSIILSSLDQKKNDELIGKEFVPKHSRPCCCVSWSLDSSTPILAAGLDRFRTDTSLLIWDVNRFTQSDSSYNSVEQSDGKPAKPLYEFGSSEGTYSLAWTSASTIITGMNKYLRVVDLRDPSKFSKTTSTKAVFGVCVDPQKEDQVASYVENQVYIWDMRRFDKASHTLPVQKNPIVKLGWCPKRLGLLGCLSKDSTSIRVFDIQHIPRGHDEFEQNYKERLVESANGIPFVSFDWNPFDENRLLTINSNGGLGDTTLFERIALDMNPCQSEQDLCFSQVRKFGEHHFNNQDDISSIIRRRALNMYGLQDKMSEKLQQFEMCPDSPQAQLWRWVDHLGEIIEQDDCLTAGAAPGEIGQTRLTGVSQIAGNVKSTVQDIPWQGIDSKSLSTLRHYDSPERETCLKICRWPHKHTSVTVITSRLEREHRFEKATAIALFHGNISEALNILNKGSELAADLGSSSGINLSIVAMALAGINTTSNTLWLSKCKQLHSKIKDPYLRASFAFLTCGDNYSQILSEKALSIADRVAFACIFLSDVKLKEFLLQLENEVITKGDLTGLILTGLDESGVELLQQYIDNTGDIQTAALVMLHSFPSQMQQDERVKSWIENYRNLLDTWKLWALRAKFDIFHKKCVKTTESAPVSQVYLSCNYCSKPVIPLQIQQRRLYNAGGYGQYANTVKVTICHECRKPLPRCALCLKNMGTASGILSTKLEADNSTDGGVKKCTDFSNWFTWCQSCHHGGHAVHIADWFKQNIECPVTACTCKCSTLDSMPSTDRRSLMT